MDHLGEHSTITKMSLQKKETADRTTNLHNTGCHQCRKHIFSLGVTNISLHWRLTGIAIIFIFCFTNVSSEMEEGITAIAMENFGCKNVGEIGERTLKPQIPNCGCGFYAQRMPHDVDHSEGRRNVSVTTLLGKTIYFECKPCRLCSGQKVEQICRPKTNTLCSEECVKPCFYFNKLVKKCIPRSNCVHSTTNVTPAPETTTTTTISPPSTNNNPVIVDHPAPDPNHHRHPPEPHNLHSWLIVAAVVLAVAIVAVIILILYACANHYLAPNRSTLQCCLLSSLSSSTEQIAGNQPGVQV